MSGPWDSTESLLDNVIADAGDEFIDSPTNAMEAEDTVAADANGEFIPVGEDLSVLELFRQNRGQWKKTRPHHRVSVKLPEHQAIVVKMDDPEGNGVWRLHSISVRSQHIRGVLAKAFEGYPGINTELEDLIFRPPFHEFFFRWSRIQDILQNGADELSTSHTELLLATLRTELQSIIDRAADMSRLGVIDFQLLWTLYEPTSEVFLRLHDYDQLALVNETEYDGKGNFFISCRVIDFDGDKVGYKTIKHVVRSFLGVKAVVDLPVFPSQKHQQIESLTEALRNRGRKFLAHCDFKYVQYSGYLEEFDSFCGPNRQYLKRGRIIIDAKALKQNMNDQSPRLEPLDKVFVVSSKPDPGDYFAVREYHRRNCMTPERDGSRSPPERGDPTETASAIELPEDSLPYCVATVRGYNLVNKRWAAFYLDSISEIEWSHLAYERLLLRPQYKKMISAVVRNHAASLGKLDDIIPGKGQGLILLLTGTPGVGKTLTAESVAEEMRKPLYAMSAGELGFSSEAVEDSLREVLGLCQKWNAVLLLDECDVFLEYRSHDDLQRNGLVAIFLRMLEYYKGILILTTNRASVIDPAFQSRIHLTLKFPKLNQLARQDIWKTFIYLQPPRDGFAPENQVSEAEIETLAKLEFNGREIKNIVRTAWLLAIEEKSPLKQEHILTVLELKRDCESVE